MTFIRTTAIDKILNLTKRKRVIPGGTSASKTFGILAVLIDTAIENPKSEISIVSESVPHLRRGALKDFLKIMKTTGRYIDANYNRTLLTYTFTNGSYMEFFSADDESKVRGARRNILFINECNNLSYETYHQLSIRTDGVIYLDYNPSNEFWVHTEVIGGDDVEVLTLTYKDNEALAQTIIDDIESSRSKAYVDVNGDLNDPENIISSYHANWWRVYGLGQLGILQGVVFDNYEIIKELPPQARLLGYGLDFGYSNDPTAFVGLYKYNDTIIYDEVLFKKALTNADICRELESEGVDKKDEIIADSAEPKSIEEIRRLGWRIYPCSKGRDSINNGIQLIQQYPFLVTERSINIIKELRHYMWATDKTGAKTGKPIEDYNDAIDSMRYITSEKMSKRAVASGTTVSSYSKRRR